MKVYIVVQHYDIGSDEFRIEAVYDSAEKAMAHIRREYPDWQPFVYEDEDINDFKPEELQYFQDIDDQEMSDRVYIEVDEVK